MEENCFCIVLKQIMHQKDPLFQQLLNCLCYELCSQAHYDFLQSYIICNCSADTNQSKLNMNVWITDRCNASPLIYYTNAVCDAHNIKAAHAFVHLSGYDFHFYYSTDTCGQGCNKILLQNEAAHAAWNTPVKAASDLSGHLPLIPGMPVFLTQNLATELGLSNGSEGTLVSVTYQLRNNKRYAISAQVDFNSYNQGSPEHPHRIMLKPVTATFSFKLPNSTQLYHGTHYQIPIIPGFAYTAHNSQGRSLNAACIDLAGYPTIACAYVMLSHICSLDGLSILHPFSFEKISKHAPQEVCAEIKRLDNLYEKTKMLINTQLSWYYDLVGCHIE